MDVKRVYRILIIIGIIILSFFLLIPQASIPNSQKKGRICRETYVAPFDFSLTDKEKTLQIIKEEQSKICPVYSFNFDVSLKLLEDITRLFSKIEKIRENNKISQKKKEERIKRLIGSLSFEDTRFIALAEKDTFIALEETTKNIMNTCLEKGILPQTITDKKIEIIKGKKGVGTITPVENLLTIKRIKISDLKELKLFPKEVTNIEELSWKIASAYLKPNLYFDKKTTNKRMKIRLKPVEVFVKKGEIIANEGEVIDSLAFEKFKAIAQMQKGISKETTFKFLIIFLLSIILIIAFILKYQRNLKEEKLMAISFVCLFIVVVAKCLTWLFSYWMCLPFAAFSILVALLGGEVLSIFLTFILGILTSFPFGLELNVFLFLSLGGIFSIFLLPLARKRADLIKVCLSIGMVNLILSLFLVDEALRLKLALSLANALLVYFTTIGLLSLFEAFFPTNFKLLELSDLNISLLRDLFLEAPGTYHHSLIVGTLAEAAALSIGANSILVRTGSYYHDIGKMINPEYFVENQKEKRIIPSPAIAKSHIERGVSIAKIKHLPYEIIEMIQSHHGTSQIGEERYPGPKPNTKESAIVMLSDSVEEKIRTYEKPSPEIIKRIVKDTLNEKISSGELSESSLTLGELKKIEESFINILTTLFHAKDEARAIEG